MKVSSWSVGMLGRSALYPMKNFLLLVISRLALSRISFAMALCLFASSALAEDWAYSVRKGDTLWDLCAKFTVVKDCWLKIGPYNKVDYPRSIPPGTRIQFPVAWLKTAPVPATITYVRGRVEVVGENNVRNAETGSSIFMGETVSTYDNSTATLLFADGSVSVLSSNSQVTLDLLSVNERNAIVDSHLTLIAGAISTKVPKSAETDSSNVTTATTNSKPSTSAAQEGGASPGSQESISDSRERKYKKSRFRVTTPSAVAAVRGTDFRVTTVKDSEVMRGEVYFGRVAVSKANTPQHGIIDEKLLDSGFGIVAQKGKALPEPTALLAAPEFANLSASSGTPIVIDWVPVTDAVAYSINVFTEDKSTDQLLQSELVTGTRWVSDSISEGCYRFLLRAIDKYELQGRAGQQRICVVQQPKKLTLVYDSLNRTVSWSPIGKTQYYVAEFSKSETFDAVQSIQLNDTIIDVDSKEIRQYPYIRVHAVGMSGIVGDPSNTVQIKKKGFSFW